MKLNELIQLLDKRERVSNINRGVVPAQLGNLVDDVTTPDVI